MEKDKTNKAINDDIKRYKEIIKEYRQKKKWTQKELAEKLNLALPTIKRYEGGSLAVPKNKIVKLFEILDMQLDDLRDIFPNEKELHSKKCNSKNTNDEKIITPS